MQKELIELADHVTSKACTLIRLIHGTKIGAKEFSGGFSPERVDAILWSGSSSFLIETKTTRADFLADAKKEFRIAPEKGVGRYRYYACPEGLIAPDELPDRWGLIYVYEGNKRARMIVGFGGSIKTGKLQKHPVYNWSVPVMERHGCIQDRSGAEETWPSKRYAFDERDIHSENKYLYALATRYKTQKFMDNIL